MQRLKGVIDSKIAEEQARSKAATAPTGASNSSARRSTSLRTESPSKRPRARSKVQDDGARGPDPSVFEAAFVIEDESENPSRVGTPAPAEVKEATTSEQNGAAAPTSNPAEELNEKPEESPVRVSTPMELPPDVRSKLRKLEKLETRYQGKRHEQNHNKLWWS